MNFTHPLAFAWLLLAIPIIMLYLRRAAIRRELTATWMFWEQVLGPCKESWLRKHQLGLSLAVQLAILACLAIASAEPRLARPENVALIVDNSGDLDGAKRLARNLLQGMHEDDRVSVFSTSPIAAHCGPTSDPEAIAGVIQAVAPGRGPLVLGDLHALLATSGREGFSQKVLVSANEAAQADAGLRVLSPGEKNATDDSENVFGPRNRSLWRLFAALAAVLLAVEWPLYHRHRLV